MFRMIQTCQDFQKYVDTGMFEEFKAPIALMLEKAEDLFQTEISSEPNWNEETIIYKVQAIYRWARNYVNLKIY